jgi:hypothetical protein
VGVFLWARYPSIHSKQSSINTKNQDHFRGKREQLSKFQGRLPSSHGHKLALTVLLLPTSLDGGRSKWRWYRSILPIRNSTSLESYGRTMPRALWWSQGGRSFLMSEVPLHCRWHSINKSLGAPIPHGGWLTGAPYSQETAFPWDPTVGLYLRPYGSPRGVSGFL